MSEDNDHASFREQCRDTCNNAQEYIKFRPALSLEHPKARFPGFRQGVTVLQAGQQVHKGAKPLPTDLIMHESLPMILSDGTKLYFDLFLPPGFENLEESFDVSTRVPALVAW
jgi:hypothetical protein